MQRLRLKPHNEPSPARAVSAFERVGRMVFRVILGFALVSVILVLVYGWLPVALTPLMIFRVGETISTGSEPAFAKKWVGLEQISPRLQYAVIAAEDFRFFEHHGFDWDAIEKAMESNAHGRKIRGASTISQQVAKNVFLWPSRSWIRKGLEAYFTMLIELFWSKERIMEVYLNVVELGDGVYGVEAASQKYFKKPALKLSSSEAALIAAVLPNPLRYHVASPSGYVRFRQTMILKRMNQAQQTVPDD